MTGRMMRLPHLCAVAFALAWCFGLIAAHTASTEANVHVASDPLLASPLESFIISDFAIERGDIYLPEYNPEADTSTVHPVELETSATTHAEELEDIDAIPPVVPQLINDISRLEAQRIALQVGVQPPKSAATANSNTWASPLAFTTGNRFFYRVNPSCRPDDDICNMMKKAAAAAAAAAAVTTKQTQQTKQLDLSKELKGLDNTPTYTRRVTVVDQVDPSPQIVSSKVAITHDNHWISRVRPTCPPDQPACKQLNDILEGKVMPKVYSRPTYSKHNRFLVRVRPVCPKGVQECRRLDRALDHNAWIGMRGNKVLAFAKKPGSHPHVHNMCKKLQKLEDEAAAVRRVTATNLAVQDQKQITKGSCCRDSKNRLSKCQHPHGVCCPHADACCPSGHECATTNTPGQWICIASKNAATNPQQTSAPAAPATASSPAAAGVAAGAAAGAAPKSKSNNKKLKILPSPTPVKKGNIIAQAEEVPFNIPCYTYMFWIKLSQSCGGTTNILYHGSNPTIPSPAFYLTAPNILRIRSAVSDNPSEGLNCGSIPVGKWTHIIFIHGQGQLTLFVNGKVTLRDQASNPVAAYGPLYLGAPWFQAAPASVADLRVYPLSVPEELITVQKVNEDKVKLMLKDDPPPASSASAAKSCNCASASAPPSCGCAAQAPAACDCQAEAPPATCGCGINTAEMLSDLAPSATPTPTALPPPAPTSLPSPLPPSPSLPLPVPAVSMDGTIDMSAGSGGSAGITPV